MTVTFVPLALEFSYNGRVIGWIGLPFPPFVLAWLESGVKDL
jgi:hypothetical protein